ncbi:MAG TPA: hypothetical protein VNL95_04575 [Dehalococcoidia bacterium]|nr:hypothetical protein [Dehalococcoidia bacterium]
MSQEAIEVPADLAQVAREHDFPLELVRRALALGFAPAAIRAQILRGISPQQAEEFISQQERLRAGQEVEVPEDIARMARKRRWPQDLVQRALRAGLSMQEVRAMLEAGLRFDQAERLVIIRERAQQRQQETPEQRQRRQELAWMNVRTEWGVRVRPGKKGLTLGSLNVGSYGDIPDYWPYQTEMPRGAQHNPGAPSMGYTIYEKAELWADNAADLYEESIQRQWKPATAIPWEEMAPLPEVQERALAQLCTYLCQNALVCSDVIGKWLKEMSYGYHEVKVYMATVGFDYARHFDVFRKRAYLNGVGMGRQSPGYYLRVIKDARRWTETSTLMFIFNTSYLIHLCQIGYYTAASEGDALIFRLAMQDLARQTAYGIKHLHYFLMRKPECREEIHSYLQRAEALFAYEDDKDRTLPEALMVLLGGGLGQEELKRGYALLNYFRRRWLRDYLARLAAAGMPERRDRLFPYLRQWSPVPAVAR